MQLLKPYVNLNTLQQCAERNYSSCCTSIYWPYSISVC